MKHRTWSPVPVLSRPLFPAPDCYRRADPLLLQKRVPALLQKKTPILSEALTSFYSPDFLHHSAQAYFLGFECEWRWPLSPISPGAFLSPAIFQAAVSEPLFLTKYYILTSGPKPSVFFAYFGTRHHLYGDHRAPGKMGPQRRLARTTLLVR